MSEHNFPGRAMSIVEIIELATTNSDFAETFRAAATAACNSSVGSPAWRELMLYFAADEYELARLMSPDQEIANPLWTGRRTTVAPPVLTHGADTTTHPTVHPDLLNKLSGAGEEEPPYNDQE